MQAQLWYKCLTIVVSSLFNYGCFRCCFWRWRGTGEQDIRMQIRELCSSGKVTLLFWWLWRQKGLLLHCMRNPVGWIKVSLCLRSVFHSSVFSLSARGVYKPLWYILVRFFANGFKHSSSETYIKFCFPLGHLCGVELSNIFGGGLLVSEGFKFQSLKRWFNL